LTLLFITRTYPPIVGGMEKFASDFYVNYSKQGQIDLLANPGGKKMIPFFIIKVIFFLILRSRNYDVIHLYDAVLSPLTLIIKVFSRAKVSFTVNGLDIVYSHFGYQSIMPFFLKKADRIFAISQYTMEQCELRGIPKEKLTVIPVGINFDSLQIHSGLKKSEVLSKFNIPTKNAKILLTVGRLVKRKGHSWFIVNVLKKLPKHYIYLIAGAGPEQDLIKGLIHELNLTHRVYLLGRVSDEEKKYLYQISDLFVMPNISVKNDQEGFGIVLLEAGRYGLPVIASNIEGIRDVVANRKTGHLIEEKDAQGFIDAIIKPEIDCSSLANTVASYFDWGHIIKRYNKEFEKMRTG
jgi:phosphatidylinositol alpha-1,6-mannosyltransferase